MCRYFGNLAKIRGITYFRLSPHEQKVFDGIIREIMHNMVRRFHENIFRSVPLFMSTMIVMSWADEVNHNMHRKNPADFANDT